MNARIVGWVMTVVGAFVAGPIVIGWVVPPDLQKAIYDEPAVYLLAGYIVLFLVIGAGLVIGRDLKNSQR